MKIKSLLPALVKFRNFYLSRFSWLKLLPVLPGKYVKLDDTIKGFKEILDGKHDDKPEQSFYMKGGIEEVK